MVQCGGTLAKACFPGWRQWRRPRIIGLPFVLGVREGIGNALIFQGSSTNASPAARRDFYMVWRPLGGRHQEHLRSAQRRLRRRLGNSLKSSDLQQTINSQRGIKGAPTVLTMLPYVARMRGCATYKSIISAMGEAARPACAARP